MSTPHKAEGGGGGGGGGGEMPAIISEPLNAITEGAPELVEKTGLGANFALDFITGVATGTGLPVEKGGKGGGGGHGH